MPIYEYRCEQCGHEFETIQKVSEAPLSECPSCHASSLKKKVSAAAFRLKGGGWYETDFKSGGKKNVVDSGSSESAAGSDGGGDTSESPKSTSDTDKSSGSTTKSGSESTTSTSKTKDAD